MTKRWFLTVVAAGVMAAWPSAQERKPVAPADYGKWETLGASVLSRDGRWLAVPIARVDGTSELRLQRGMQTGGTADAEPVFRAAEGREPAFGDDGRWLAYRVGQSDADREKLQDEKKPIRDKVGLLPLDGDVAKATAAVVDGVSRLAFAPGGEFIALQRYVPEGAKRKGADLLVRHLATGAAATFGNVAEFAWQDGGSLLAMTIDSEARPGNGVHVYDPKTGLLRVLDSGDADFSSLAWRRKDDDLAALRSRADDAYEEPTQLVLAWRDLGQPGAGAAARPASIAYDQVKDASFSKGMRIAASRRPQWSEDGATLFVGIQEWEAKPETAKSEAGEKKAAEAAKAKPATVEVWHAKDERIIAMQRVQKTRDRDKNLLAAWPVGAASLVRLGTDADETTTVLEGDRFVVETDRTPYLVENLFDSPRRDVYVIDVKSGDRHKAIEGVWYFEGGSATGRYLLYFKDDQFWTYDIETRQHACISRGLKASWVNTDYDTPVRKQKPPYGDGGWLKADRGVLLYDRHDVWRVAPDGSGGARLTRGAEEQIRHRYVRLDPEERGVDPDAPIYFSLMGEWTKRSGFARLMPGAASVERLLWVEQSAGRLAKAKAADVLTYVAQDFDDPPDVFVGGPTLEGSRQATRTNPFHGDYAWGKPALIEYRTPKGDRLQGALFYPAGYTPGRQYPMIVYVYERLSQGVHTYSAPSERTPYNTSVFTADGYFVLQPDIVFRPRDPGVSATECVVAAVKQVLASGMVDPKRVGLVGHSWGGYETTFIPTQTKIFSAAVAGAPITNFLSFFGAIHWNQGMPETQHFETGQARMDVPYWVDMQAYVRNSPVMFIQQLDTPMLVFFGDKDGTVDWHQGVEFYNYARRAGKFVVMLVYLGENHSAREKPNQIDYHRRIRQWFGHFLKGEPAPAWITEGQTLLDREKEVKREPGAVR